LIAQPSAPPSDAEIRDRILGGFRGDVPPLRPSIGYRLALAGVAFAMVLLPVVYAGLISIVGWGLWAYGRFFFVLALPEARHWLSILLELLPLLTGTLVLLALVKPLFARAARPSPPVRLSPQEEPLLFEFVARLCAALHAPVPREIHVNCQVNALASFRPGLLSWFRHDLILTLGLPLVADLSLQQLAGVMAHELGHFSQKSGLRVSTVIRRINVWLARLVYQRDRFDLALETSARQIRNVFLRMSLRIALFGVTVTRKILWTLMMLGHTLSSHMMRQMEYDADRYEVRLAGFSSFDLCMRELFSLGAAYTMAMGNLQEQWKERRLVDNFPRLVLANRIREVQRIAVQIDRQIAQEPELPFSTHPTARRRTARALREKGVGVFSSDLPAGALFANLEALERRTSLAFYKELVGNQVRPQDLLPMDDVKERQERVQSERAALERYFRDPNPLKGLPLPPELPPPADPAAAIAELGRTRTTLAARDEGGHAGAGERYRTATKERLVALRAQAVIQAGYSIRAGDFNLTDGQLVSANRAAAEAQSQMKWNGEQLASFEAVEVRRLLLSLSLLELPRVAARLPELEHGREEAKRLLACASFLSARFPGMFALRETLSRLEILSVQVKPDQENPRLNAALQEHMDTLQEQLKELHRGLRDRSYPFDHARREITLAQFTIPAMPPANDFQRLLVTAEQALERLHDLYERLLGRLTWLAEQAETALDLPALAPSPAPESSPATSPSAGPHIPESKASAVTSRERFVLYFCHPLEVRTLPLPDTLPEVATADPRAALAAARDAALERVKENAENVRRYQILERKYFKALRAEVLLAAEIAIQPADFELPRADARVAEQARERALAEMSTLEPALQSFEEIQTRRLLAALTLLESGEARIAEADSRCREAPPLLACVAAVQRRFPLLRELRKAHAVLESLAAHAPASSQLPGFQGQVAERMSQAQKYLQELQRSLHTEPCPLVGPEGPVDLARVAVPKLPRSTDYNGIFNSTGWALRELTDLHRRLLGRLAGTAEEVERTLSQ
jgi:Zn-dependent protease with chaperone function